MFELQNFYRYCRENHVDIIPYTGIPQPGATIRDGSHYAVFLDFSQIKTTRLLRGVCAHELSHLTTGALHRPSSPFDLAERSEYRANRYFSQHFLTEKSLKTAFSQGYTEPWQLAEYFDLPEQDIEKALHYWTNCRGINFNLMENEECRMENECVPKARI